jgi:hypothetical protein
MRLTLKLTIDGRQSPRPDVHMMPRPTSAFNRFLASEKTAYQKLQVPLTGRWPLFFHQFKYM